MTLDELIRYEQRELAAVWLNLVNEVARIDKARDGVSFDDFQAGEIGQFIAEKARAFEQQRMAVRVLLTAKAVSNSEGM